MKQGGIAGPGIAISFLMRKKVEEYDREGNIIVVERDAPVSYFAHKTKRKVMNLLGLTSDSSVDDCQAINDEIWRRK